MYTTRTTRFFAAGNGKAAVNLDTQQTQFCLIKNGPIKNGYLTGILKNNMSSAFGLR